MNDIEREKEKVRKKLAELYGPHYFPVATAMTNYYKDTQIEPTIKEWNLWIENLAEPMKSGYKAKGIEQSETALPFRRFCLELNDTSMRDYLKDKLTDDQFQYYLDQTKKASLNDPTDTPALD